MNQRTKPTNRPMKWKPRPFAHLNQRAALALSVTTLLASTVLPIFAYPPAPAVSVYGLVRDQFGWVIDYRGAEIVFKSGSKEIARQPIVSNLKFNESFRAQLPVDTNGKDSAYRQEALAPSDYFTVEVHIDGKVYHPIESFIRPDNGKPVVRGAFQIVEAGDSIRLDLSLGEDADGDQLPDAWERWQLETIGLDENDPLFGLDILSPDNDADRDGVSDLEEFRAGTIALFPDDSLRLDVVRMVPGEFLELEYPAVKDKAYILEMSDDGKVWVSARVALDDPLAPPKSAWFAEKSSEQTLFAPADQPFRIFRLRVR